MGWKGILGFEYGIIQAPMGPDLSNPELVAAVANAGCLGLLRTPDSVRKLSSNKIVLLHHVFKLIRNSFFNLMTSWLVSLFKHWYMVNRVYSRSVY
jgi:hypothetical protein